MFYLLSHAFVRALVITAFVFMMMVIVEYINILLRGRLMEKVSRRPVGQSALASFLGATPGCLGAFANVAMYEHGILSFGALVAGMIATSGDESFVMLSMFPGRFFILVGILFAVGLITGFVLDKFLPYRFFRCIGPQCRDLVIHEHPDLPPFGNPVGQLVENLSGRQLTRWAMLVILLTFALLVLSGAVASDHTTWLRAALLALTAVCILITLFGTEHFIKEHVWHHVALKHMPKVFLWTFGVLFIFAVLSQYVDIPLFVQKNRYLMLLAACVIGIIPESGPHLIFVMLFAEGALPFSILLASSVVQDGHGMLPLLAFSRRDFVAVKLINLVIGLLLGVVLLAIGI